jgi:hypothetical protein
LLFVIDAPMATPIATPMASQVPPDPKATSMAMPMPAPSAMPSPICIDGLFISSAPSCRPYGTRSFSVLTQGLGPFDFAQGGL